MLLWCSHVVAKSHSVTGLLYYRLDLVYVEPNPNAQHMLQLYVNISQMNDIITSPPFYQKDIITVSIVYNIHTSTIQITLLYSSSPHWTHNFSFLFSLWCTAFTIRCLLWIFHLRGQTFIFNTTNETTCICIQE